MNIELYVYYRVPCEHAALLQARVRAMQSSLSAEHGVVATLKRRPDEKDDKHTWMEVYQGAPSGFESLLERVVAQVGVAALIDGSRHTEYFMDCSTCA